MNRVRVIAPLQCDCTAMQWCHMWCSHYRENFLSLSQHTYIQRRWKRACSFLWHLDYTVSLRCSFRLHAQCAFVIHFVLKVLNADMRAFRSNVGEWDWIASEHTSYELLQATSLQEKRKKKKRIDLKSVAFGFYRTEWSGFSSSLLRCDL